MTGPVVHVLRFVSLGFLIAAAALTARARQPLDYPQWRGLNRDGAASGFVEPSTWPKTLTKHWKINVGEGHATPILVGDIVYAFTRRADGEGLTAINAKTGAELWRSAYAAPYSPSVPAAAHGAGPKATPLFYQGRIYTLGISGIVAAFDAATGRIAWKTTAPEEPPFFGAAASPLATDGLIVTHPGDYGPLTAFDAASGAIKWTAGDQGFFAAPLLATLGGVRQVVTMTQKGVVGISVRDGRLLWQYAFPAGGGGPSPLVFDDMVIVSAIDAGVVAIRTSNQNGNWNVEKIWETKEVSMYLSNPVIITDAIYGLSQRSSGQYFALDGKSGKTLWLGQPREAANAAIVKSGDLLFLLNDDAELVVARGSRAAFTPLTRYAVADSATWAQPLISGQRVFIKDAASLTLWTVN